TSESDIRETVDSAANLDTAVAPLTPEEEVRHLASIVHNRLTPSRRIGLPGLFVEVAYHPSGSLGGDGFHCVEIGERWVLAVFDSMNHGAKSALALSLLRAEMERCVNLTAQPSQCLDWMNS